MQDVPDQFCREPFLGFDMKDDEIESSPYRGIAIELKHLFESLLADAEERNEEFFLAPELDTALRAFVRRPSNFTLCVLLAISPDLEQPLREMAMLVSPSLLVEFPGITRV